MRSCRCRRTDARLGNVHTRESEKPGLNYNCAAFMKFFALAGNLEQRTANELRTMPLRTLAGCNVGRRSFPLRTTIASLARILPCWSRLLRTGSMFAAR